MVNVVHSLLGVFENKINKGEAKQIQQYNETNRRQEKLMELYDSKMNQTEKMLKQQIEQNEKMLKQQIDHNEKRMNLQMEHHENRQKQQMEESEKRQKYHLKWWYESINQNMKEAKIDREENKQTQIQQHIDLTNLLLNTMNNLNNQPEDIHNIADAMESLEK